MLAWPKTCCRRRLSLAAWWPCSTALSYHSDALSKFCSPRSPYSKASASSNCANGSPPSAAFWIISELLTLTTAAIVAITQGLFVVDVISPLHQQPDLRHPMLPAAKRAGGSRSSPLSSGSRSAASSQGWNGRALSASETLIRRVSGNSQRTCDERREVCGLADQSRDACTAA